VGGAPRGASSSSSSRLSARVSRAGETRRVRCAWTAKRTLAFRRSTVAIFGRDPAFAGASAGKPASALASVFLPRHCRRIRRSRASRGKRLAAAGRHSPLRLQDRLRRRPSMSEDANLYTMDAYRSQAQIVVTHWQSLHLSPHAIWEASAGSTAAN